MKFRLFQPLFVFATFFVVAGAAPPAYSTVPNTVGKKDFFADAVGSHARSLVERRYSQALQHSVNSIIAKEHLNGKNPDAIMSTLGGRLYIQDNNSYLIYDASAIVPISTYDASAWGIIAKAYINGIRYGIIQVTERVRVELYYIDPNWPGPHVNDKSHWYAIGEYTLDSYAVAFTTIDIG